MNSFPVILGAVVGRIIGILVRNELITSEDASFIMEPITQLDFQNTKSEVFYKKFWGGQSDASNQRDKKDTERDEAGTTSEN